MDHVLRTAAPQRHVQPLRHSGALYVLALNRAERDLIERGDSTTSLEQADIVLRRTRELGQLGDRARAMAGVSR